MSEVEKRTAYNADVTYATNNELGFDYLRDNMKSELHDISQRAPYYAIVDEVDSILIDEAQFLTKKQVWELTTIVDSLNIPVMCYGLRTDFQGNLFPGSSCLLALADVLREIRTICHCGKKAIMVVRQNEEGKVIKDGDQIEIGGNEKYVSFCRYHWKQKMEKI